MAQAQASGWGGPILAVLILLSIVAAVVLTAIFWNPAILGLVGIAGTFMVLSALIIVSIS
ncbi:hypothetical protein ACT6QG_01670 [Xanthobacter sp. TB0136]|uniref:hypothetical protein n=1 Tax=Xanthobacter sp. TB0136 TaxID=3459177 RepID=UPI004039D76A